MMTQKQWSPWTWQNFKVLQQATYADPELAQKICYRLQSAKPLVSYQEIIRLRKQLCAVENNQTFLLQNGDCAESFDDACPQKVFEKISFNQSLCQFVEYTCKTPVLHLGRIAGQYAKPRTHLLEIINGTKIPAFRGLIINDIQENLKLREPDPLRLQIAYNKAASVYNWLKYYDTKKVHQYALKSFTSHEGLLLNYESSLTRKDPQTQNIYNSSAHMLWIGERTRDLGKAHLEFFRGISNPIGIKVASRAHPQEITETIKTLNPHNERAKIIVIYRFGVKNVASHLPQLIAAIQKSKQNCSLICDPMHGNTYQTKENKKMRKIEHIISELQIAQNIHKHMNRPFQGVHLETTPENVTECEEKSPHLDNPTQKHTSLCDPRLNRQQTLYVCQSLSAATSMYKKSWGNNF